VILEYSLSRTVNCFVGKQYFHFIGFLFVLYGLRVGRMDIGYIVAVGGCGLGWEKDGVWERQQ